MGKKRVAILGSGEEEQLRAKRAEKLQQKKLREGLPADRRAKTAKAPGLKGGQRIVDTASESLIEYEVIQKKLEAAQELAKKDRAPTPVKPTRVRSTAYQNAKKAIELQSYYNIEEAIKLLRRVSLTKFDPTVELHLTLQNKGLAKDIKLPYSSGKTQPTLSLRSQTATPLVHTIVGKLSQPDDELSANIAAVLATVSPGVKKAVLKSTMSPGIKILL